MAVTMDDGVGMSALYRMFNASGTLLSVTPFTPALLNRVRNVLEFLA